MSFCGNCGIAMKDGTCLNCGIDEKPAKVIHSEPPIKNIYSDVPNKNIYASPINNPNQYNQIPLQSPINYPLPPTRSYITWLLRTVAVVILGFIIIILSFFTEYFILILVGYLIMIASSGIMIYYQYLTYKDFKDLNIATHGGHIYDRSMDPAVGLLLYFFVLPAAIFVKYNQLHEHIKQKHPDEDAKPPNPILVLGIMISPIFLIFFSIFFSILVFESNLIIILFILVGIVYVFIPFLFIYFENKWQNSLNYHILKHKSFMK